MILIGETEVKGETPVPVSLCSPQQKKTTEEHVTSFGAGQDKLQNPQHTLAFYTSKVPYLSKQFIYGNPLPYYKRYFVIREESENDISIGIKCKLSLFDAKLNDVGAGNIYTSFLNKTTV